MSKGETLLLVVVLLHKLFHVEKLSRNKWTDDFFVAFFTVIISDVAINARYFIIATAKPKLNVIIIILFVAIWNFC